MSDDKDPFLQSLFSEAEEDLPGESFTVDVMAKAEAIRKRSRFLWIGITVLLLPCLWFLAPLLQQSIGLLTESMTFSPLAIENQTLAEMLYPINNIGFVMFIGIVSAGVLYRRILS